MPVQRASGATSLLDALDRVLDKGIVIHGREPMPLAHIDLTTDDGRVVAAIDTSLGYPDADS